MASPNGHARQPVDVAIAAAAIRAFLDRRAEARVAATQPRPAWWRAGIREAQAGRL
jgi:hypothetical protein